MAGNPNLTTEFAAALVGLGRDGLPGDVAHETRRSLLNVLGTTVGASHSPEVDAVVGMATKTPSGGVPVPGRHEPLVVPDAALAIGLAGHRDDFDDTHPGCLVHASAAVLGTVYPLAVRSGVDALTLLTATALGIESQLRAGMAMTPSHYDIGWHSTGTCGVLGAAVAAGVMRGYAAEELANALRIAAIFSVGHREAFGTPIKPYHSGKAAANGLFAADLARLGIGADLAGLESDGGYFDVLSDSWAADPLTTDHVASRWLLLENTYKAFPCGVVAHPAIEAAIALSPKLGDPIEEVREITVECHPLVVELMGRPTARTGLEARFCTAHGVAVGLLDGRASTAEFSDDRANDPRVEALRSRISLLPDPSVGLAAARLRVRRQDGSGLDSTVDAVVGSAERPLTDAMLRRKFGALTEPVLSARSGELADAVLGLGESASFADVVEMLVP